MSSPKPRILVVDDVPADLQSLAGLLADDFEVLTAASGPDALRLAESEEIDLVVLDAQMPGMDGFETCARLRAGEATRALPVLLVGTPEEEAMEAKGLVQGAVDFLPRPIRSSLTRARIKVHLENRRLREILQRLTWLDAVTGIPNQERFEEALDSEWRRNARNHTPVALLLMEPDHFNHFCGTYGKPAGDEALRRLLESVTGGIQRAGDVMGRYGENRFACLLPETDTVGAVSVGEKIRAELSALAIPHEGSPAAPTLTLSIGLVSVTPGRNDLLDEFKKDAEEALLRAQQRGGDQVVFG